MPTSPRAILRAALSLAGVVGLAATAPAQQPQDSAVHKTTTQGQAPAAPAPAGNPQPIPQSALVPATFGTIDIQLVMKNYDKVKVKSEKFQADAMAEQEKLLKLQAEGKNAVERLQRFKPGTDDYKKITEELSDIKAKLDSKKEQLQAEFQMREVEAMVDTFNEIQQMTEAVAKKYKMAYVVKHSREPLTMSDRESVMASMSQALMFADGATDITKEVTYYLNVRYLRSGAPRPKTEAAPAQANGANATAPGGAKATK